MVVPEHAARHHDYDSLEMPVLVDAREGQGRAKLLLQANRNGFYYILDRTDGEFLHPTQFVRRVDWLKGWDDKAAPSRSGARSVSEGTTTVLRRRAHQLAVAHL